MNIGKNDLEKMRDWLVEERLDEQSLEWLKKRRVGLFEGGKIPEKLEEAKKMLLYPNEYNLSLVNSSKKQLSFTIQDLLNALVRKDRFGYTPNGNLSKESLLELAEIMNIKETERMRRSELLRAIRERLPENS